LQLGKPQETANETQIIRFNFDASPIQMYKSTAAPLHSMIWISFFTIDY
jgi:hypothetical protein